MVDFCGFFFSVSVLHLLTYHQCLSPIRASFSCTVISCNLLLTLILLCNVMFYIPLAENTYIYFYGFVQQFLKVFTHCFLYFFAIKEIFLYSFQACPKLVCWHLLQALLLMLIFTACLLLLPIEFSPLLVFLEVFWKNWLFLSFFFFISHSVLHFLIQISRWIVLKPDNTLTEFVVLSHEKKKSLYIETRSCGETKFQHLNILLEASLDFPLVCLVCYCFARL